MLGNNCPLIMLHEVLLKNDLILYKYCKMLISSNGL